MKFSFFRWRKGILLSFLGLILLTGCSAKSPSPQVTKVGILVADSTRTAKFEGFKQGLAELGYGEGKMSFQVLNAEGNSQKLTVEAKELVRQAPDLLVAAGFAEAEAILHASDEKSKIPVLMIGVTSASDLADEFKAREIPVSGIDNGHVELTGKRLELLQLLFPDRTKILNVYDPGIQASQQALDEVHKILGSKTRYEDIPVSETLGLSRLQNHDFQKNEAILLLPSYTIESNVRKIRDLELQERVPVMGFYDTEVAAGYTAAYGLSYHDSGYQAARLAIRMLKEKKSIPFDMPDSVQLEVNRLAIQRIGEKLSPTGQSFAVQVDTIQK
ncbi:MULTISPECIES: ABC transporter substrate-binding protein [Desulfosporosinus]|uniref:ABC transporter substrate binding protein n=1 Tax=Desulfosporosinus acididurans TaxID=476652 RepID=A0A0J1IH41_9FIRM|nr:MULTISPECIES: ABC transporter substrate-binding protein [Desulfosporosinus]KLU63976.1 ABC transporter substrate binding protein [Desulfosporosinus acididurans]